MAVEWRWGGLLNWQPPWLYVVATEEMIHTVVSPLASKIWIKDRRLCCGCHLHLHAHYFSFTKSPHCCLNVDFLASVTYKDVSGL